MRASRLVELLVRLQLRGGASASALAAELEVSVRTVYRDVEALSAAGVPVYTELGRGGGVRLDPSYRIAGLPRLGADEARGLLFAAVPAIAAQLGLDARAAERTLLPAMDRSASAAARVVRDRLLIEPTHWFVPTEETPALGVLAEAVWRAREVRMDYRERPVVIQPLGLVLKGDRWYALARSRPGDDRPYRLFRLSRAGRAELLDRPFDRPADFDLADAWAQTRQAFLASLPAYDVTVRVAPAAEPLLGLLDEAAPDLPLPGPTPRDRHGWALLHLRFERSPEGAARQLLRLGAGVEVLGPPDLRARLATIATELSSLYDPEPRR